MYIGLHVKCPLFLSDINTIRFSQQIFEKYSSIICHENPVSGSLVVPYGRTDGQTDRQTEITKLIGIFPRFANAPKNFMIYFSDRNSFTLLFYTLFQSKLGDNILPVFTLNLYHLQCPTILLAIGVNYTAQAFLNLIILRTF